MQGKDEREETEQKEIGKGSNEGRDGERGMMVRGREEKQKEKRNYEGKETKPQVRNTIRPSQK